MLVDEEPYEEPFGTIPRACRNSIGETTINLVFKTFAANNTFGPIPKLVYDLRLEGVVTKPIDDCGRCRTLSPRLYQRVSQNPRADKGCTHPIVCECTLLLRSCTGSPSLGGSGGTKQFPVACRVTRITRKTSIGIVPPSHSVSQASRRLKANNGQFS